MLSIQYLQCVLRVNIIDSNTKNYVRQQVSTDKVGFSVYDDLAIKIIAKLKVLFTSSILTVNSAN